jgi:hypothetical protein
MWRIKYIDTDDLAAQLDYPPFVTRAFPKESKESYGGLEPFLSSVIGKGLVKSLELAKRMRPTDVAYVSLLSLSLGSRPPVIRSVKLSNKIVKEDETQIELDLEVDALLEDLSMIFSK